MTKLDVEWIKIDMNWNAQDHSKWQLLINDGLGAKRLLLWLEDNAPVTRGYQQKNGCPRIAYACKTNVDKITMDNDE